MDLKKNINKMFNQGNAVLNDNLAQSIIQRTFGWLGIILAIMFGTAKYLSVEGIVISSFMFWTSAILGLIIIIAISFFYEKMNYITLSGLAIIFALLEGLGISGIFNAYSGNSILGAFLGASVLFSIMAIYGYITKRDLTKMGTILLIGLISIIIISLINIFFLHSSILETGISIISILIFLGFTAYDLQILKGMASTGDRRLEIVFGISLFLDFINIFLNLLGLFGSDD